MTRSWLRSIVQLGARMQHDGVPLADVERQEDTVLRALDLLVDHPGIVLADEVGMGKTFEALGIIAATLHGQPASKIFIVTPGPDLNRNWMNAIATFSDPSACLYDFGERVAEARTLDQLIIHARSPATSIVVVPISAFQGARGGHDQAYLISLLGHWLQLHGSTTNAMLDRFRPNLDRVDVTRERFLGAFPLADIWPHVEHAMRGTPGTPDDPGLADLYAANDLAAFARTDAIKRALDRARFRLVRALLPELELLVIDEAHKLKNPESLRHRGIATVFDRKFERSLFLTATPFQLEIDELRQVFSLFARAREVPDVMASEIEGLFDSIADYQHTYDELVAHWRSLDAAGARLFADHYAADPTLATLPTNPVLVPVVRALRGVKQLKHDRIEPGLRSWMVRSTHGEKQTYRRHDPIAVAPAGDSLLPFLVYERFIDELFRTGDPTHKAAVEATMVSSFEAAQQGALFTEGRKLPSSADQYRGLLREVLGTGLADHPKIGSVVDDALAAACAEPPEKTLIFCNRGETIATLGKTIEAAWQDRLVTAWQRVYPRATSDEIFGSTDDDDDDDDGARDPRRQPEGQRQRQRGHFGRIRDRLHRTQDLLYLALRERYLKTLVPARAAVIGHEAAIAARATELLHQKLRVGATSAARVDYQLAKRCIERAAVERWCAGPRPIPAQFAELAAMLTSDAFLHHGIDLERDDLEGDEPGRHVPTWSVTEAMVDVLASNRPHLWHTLSKDLARIVQADGQRLDLPLRVRVVELVARYLTRRDVLFLPELLRFARGQCVEIDTLHSHELVVTIDQFWATPAGERWVHQLRELLRYVMMRPDKIRREILEGPIARGTFVRHTLESDTREALREAFNTPLHPMVLVANEVMQEGLDLHHNCRRIVHHDLAWNPAQLEQRVGRIDRIGSLIRRQRETHPDQRLEVRYPLIERTIDERMYRTVKKRERWLELLLGARPDFNELGLEEPAAPLPQALAESLVIDLRPPRAR